MGRNTLKSIDEYQRGSAPSLQFNLKYNTLPCRAMLLRLEHANEPLWDLSNSHSNLEVLGGG